MDGIQPGGSGSGELEDPSSSEDDEPEDRPVPVRITSRRRAAPRQIPQNSTAPTIVDNSVPAAASASSLQRAHSISTLFSLPSSIWGSPWAPQRGPYIVLGNMDLLAEQAYDAATDGVDGVELHLFAADVAGLVNITKQLIKDAIETKDFTKLLSPSRSFNL